MYNLGSRVLPGRLWTDNEDFYNLLAQIIAFQLLLLTCQKEERKRGFTIEYKNTSEPHTDFMRTLLRKKAELSRVSSLKGCRPYLKGKELIVSRVTRVKSSKQTWWVYINHDMAMHKDFVLLLLLIKKKPSTRDLILKLPVLWIPAITKHNSQSVTKPTYKGINYNNQNNNENRKAQMTARRLCIAL